MKINFQTPSANYPVVIKAGLLASLKLPLRSYIISNHKIIKLYKKYFKKYPVVSFPAGERYKNFNTIMRLTERLMELEADRFGTLVSFGGGVVGDVTGFLASIYMRGLPYIQIPTTLLAMADAAVGGKTGIDLDEGKNMLGTFWQPKAVYIDPLVLKTLSAKEWREGMAEVIKHGIIDGKLFNWIIINKEKIKNQDKKILEQMIYKNCLVKKKIVEADEREQGKRAILNLGHTFAHALEVLSDYQINHGDAVSMGLVQAAKISQADFLPELLLLLKYFQLPITLPAEFKAQDIIGAMKHDKKNIKSQITLIVPVKLGKIKIVKNYLPKKIIQCLNQ